MSVFSAAADQGIDWTRWLFREEKLHSAVLAHLLAGSNGHGVARELVKAGTVGAGSLDVCVDREWPGESASGADQGVELESPVSKRPTGKRGRVADLSCGLLVHGKPRRLVVEMKIDSAGSRDQLRDMSWANDHVVFVALGTSAFDRSQDDVDLDAAIGFVDFHDDHLKPMDLAAAAPARVFENGRRAWPVVDVATWTKLLHVGRAADDPLLGAYVHRLETEAELYAAVASVPADQALNVNELRGVDTPQLDARARRLAPSAWALTVRRQLWQTYPHLNMTAARDGRGTRGLLWPSGWGESDGVPGNLYLQFDVSVGPDGIASAIGAVRASGRWQDNSTVRDALAAMAVCEVPETVRTGESVALARSKQRFELPRDAAEWACEVVESVNAARKRRRRAGGSR